MSDLLLQDGDLVADKHGDISSCVNEDIDIIQSANNNILLRFSGNKYHDNLGNKVYGRRIKANQNGLEIVRSECINAIMNSDPRIKKIKQINASLSDNANCTVDYILIYAKSDTGELIEVDGRTYVDAFNIGGE